MVHSQRKVIRKAGRIATLALVLFMATSSQGALAAMAVYTVTAQKVNVRAQPDTGADILLVVRKGSDLTLISSDEDGWLKVSVNGKVGYVSAEYAALSEILSGGGTLKAIVDAKKLYLRDTPSSSGKSLALLERGAELTVTSRSGDWLAVEYNGQKGYISGDYVRLSTGEAGSVAPSVTVAPSVETTDGLTVGSRGENVRALQQKLIDLGYLSGSADGFFGSHTEKALLAFQKAQGLSADGVAGSMTLSALENAQFGGNTGEAPSGSDDSSTGTTLLKKGDQGENVRALQSSLITLGYLTGEADGQYGSATKAAVTAFQAASGLKADGQAGEKTQNAIASAIKSIASAGTLTKGDRGDAVRALQQKLVALGYLSASADGLFGETTKAAVMAFQSAQGLSADGVAGSATKAALDKAYQGGATGGSTVTAPSDITKGEITILPGAQPASYPTIKYGAEGEAVERLQTRLKELGYFSGTVGGNFGTITRTAVMAFQAAASLSADGIVGGDTWAALYASDAPTTKASTLKPGDQGEAVKSLQTRLKELGYLSGSADGDFGENTRTAVRAFQTAAGISSDGIAGPQTLAALYASNAPAAGTTSAPANPGTTTAPANPGTSSGIKDTDYETGAQIVELAKKYLGCKYVYAREAPPYFDCSGLTQYVYKQFGYSLKRTAYLQGYDDTWPKIKSIGDLQIGDLIYFNTNETDADLSDHAGIYMGDGNFIHASSSAGKVVINSLTSGYYREHFSWGRRLLNQ